MPTQVISYVSTKYTSTFSYTILLERDGNVWRPVPIVRYRNLEAYYAVSTDKEYIVIDLDGSKKDVAVDFGIRLVRYTPQGEEVMKQREFVIGPWCRNRLVKDLLDAVSQGLFHRPIELDPSSAYEEEEVAKLLEGSC